MATKGSVVVVVAVVGVVVFLLVLGVDVPVVCVDDLVDVVDDVDVDVDVDVVDVWKEQPGVKVTSSIAMFPR